MGSVTTVRSYILDKKKKNPNLRIGSLHDITEAQKYPPIPTGNLVMDYITSIGGFPRGLVTEIRGATSSGKSTSAAMAAAQHQKAVKAGEATGAILYMDFENTVSEKYFQNLGLDTTDEDTFIYLQPETLEEGFNIFLEMTKEGLLGLGIVDSVAAASAESEYEATIGKLSIGNRAKALHQALRMCVGPMRVQGTALLLINHTQVKIPQTFGEKQAAMRGIQQTISPGGKAIEYYTSLRIDLAQPSNNKTEVQDDLTNEKTKQITSTDVLAWAFKSKVGTPQKMGKMRVQFGKGFNQVYSAFHILVDHKYIGKKAGGRYDFPEQLLPEGLEKVPVGEENILKAIEENPEWTTLLIDVARKVILKDREEQGSHEVVISDDYIEEEDGTLVDPNTGEVVDSE